MRPWNLRTWPQADAQPVAAKPAEERAHARIAEIAPSKRRLRPLDFKELWRYRDLAAFLALRDVRLRYRQTFFGLAWAVLQPLAAALAFLLVLNTAVSIPTEGFPYLILVFAGLLAWQVFSTGLGSAAAALVEDQSLVTRVYFPRLAAPIAALVPGLIDLAVSLVALAVLMVAYDVAPGLPLLTMPLWLGAVLAVTLGAGALLSALNVQYRDVRYTLVFLTQLWFFASPVVFPSSLVDGTGRLLLAVNPLCGVIDGWRWALIDAPPPPPADLISLASGILLVATGLLYFRATEHRFADVI